ncbi:hypothetical protein EYF80_011155 [Liparis tanakae]|uniref:Uncharacterized protein n=1 Tax=Liparis tanakae TaxID=230148 RepID=A0A4Z2IKK0_9TELE|nr:hypothetical protein EYF80_011155 [Liparis tanakae]
MIDELTHSPTRSPQHLCVGAGPAAAGRERAHRHQIAEVLERARCTRSKPEPALRPPRWVQFASLWYRHTQRLLVVLSNVVIAEHSCIIPSGDASYNFIRVQPDLLNPSSLLLSGLELCCDSLARSVFLHLLCLPSLMSALAPRKPAESSRSCSRRLGPNTRWNIPPKSEAPPESWLK